MQIKDARCYAYVPFFLGQIAVTQHEYVQHGLAISFGEATQLSARALEEQGLDFDITYELASLHYVSKRSLRQYLMSVAVGQSAKHLPRLPDKENRVALHTDLNKAWHIFTCEKAGKYRTACGLIEKGINHRQLTKQYHGLFRYDYKAEETFQVIVWERIHSRSPICGLCRPYAILRKEGL